MTATLMPTYPPPPVTFVRGEGSRLWDADGKALPRLPRRAGRDVARPRPSGGGRRHRRAGPHAAARLATSTAPTLGPEVAATLDRLLGGGGGRSSSATRAPRPTSAPSSWPASGPAAAATRSSAPTARSTGARWPRCTPPASPRSTSRSSRCPRASATSPGRPRRPRRGGRPDVVAAVLLEPMQGEGGVNPATGRVPAERPPAVRRARRPAHPRRGADRARPHRAVVRLPARRRPARRGDHGQGPGQRHADRRLLGPADVADAFEPGDHATTFGGQPLAAAAARAVLAVMEDEDVPARRRAGRRPPAGGAGGARPASPRCGAWACCWPPSWARARRPRRSPPAALDAGPRRQCGHAHRHPPGPVAARDRRRDRRGHRHPREGAAPMRLGTSSTSTTSTAAELARGARPGRVPRPAAACSPARASALLFEKPSPRTRSSMEMAVVQLGGHPSRCATTRSASTAGSRPRTWPGSLSGYHARARRPGSSATNASSAWPARRRCRSSTCSPTTPTPARPSPTCSPCASTSAGWRGCGSPTSATATTSAAR